MEYKSKATRGQDICKRRRFGEGWTQENVVDICKRRRFGESWTLEKVDKEAVVTDTQIEHVWRENTWWAVEDVCFAEEHGFEFLDLSYAAKARTVWDQRVEADDELAVLKENLKLKH